LEDILDRQKLLEYSNIFSSSEFEATNCYQGNDLGAVWTKEATHFRVWAPTASRVVLNLYRTGDQDDLFDSLPMFTEEKGTWVTRVLGDLNGTYYTYSVTVDGETHTAVDSLCQSLRCERKPWNGN
jgi:pullulanase